MATHYSILGVSDNASSDELKSAFKKLAVKFHPDKNPNNPEAEERFKQINQAYQTLSNPYERARYDLQLQYGQQAPKFDFDPHSRKTPTYDQYTYKRPPIPVRKINWRKNWIATGYALAFTFIVAAIAMSVFWTLDHLEQVRIQELISARRASFNRAQTLINQGQLDLGLSTLDSLKSFMSIEADMKEFKKDQMNFLSVSAERHYNMLQYQEAIYYYELAERYDPSFPLDLQEHLAHCYRAAGLPHHALKKLTELLLEGFQSMTIYLEKAEIYRDNLNNAEESLRHFKLASDVAIQQYKSTYGEGYLLVMSGANLPKHHYRIYTGLAAQYLKLQEFELARKATSWNIRMWPDSIENYVYAFEANKHLNLTTDACEALNAAIALGYSTKINYQCQ
ncbi:MAG: DnaJ domain-containing protein [Cyclobacteriaceae bacterium]